MSKKTNPQTPRESEDDRARRALGGVKGSPRLTPAPLVQRERDQEPIKRTPEHPGLGAGDGTRGAQRKPGLMKRPKT